MVCITNQCVNILHTYSTYILIVCVYPSKPAFSSVAVKMSLAVSMIGMILIYSEAVTPFKVIGIVLALSGVLLVSMEKNKTGASRNSLQMLLILFIGSGILDLTLNYAQQHVLNHLTPALFSSFGFGIAGLIGAIIVIYQLIFS